MNPAKATPSFMAIAETLPTDTMTNGRENIAWFDGEEILCKTSEVAELVANIIDAVCGEAYTNTGYYNPEEDASEPYGPFKTTGWYYISVD